MGRIREIELVDEKQVINSKARKEEKKGRKCLVEEDWGSQDATEVSQDSGKMTKREWPLCRHGKDP